MVRFVSGETAAGCVKAVRGWAEGGWGWGPSEQEEKADSLAGAGRGLTEGSRQLNQSCDSWLRSLHPHNSAGKRNDILVQAVTRMNLTHL